MLANDNVEDEHSQPFLPEVKTLSKEDWKTTPCLTFVAPRFSSRQCRSRDKEKNLDVEEEVVEVEVEVEERCGAQ